MDEIIVSKKNWMKERTFYLGRVIPQLAVDDPGMAIQFAKELTEHLIWLKTTGSDGWPQPKKTAVDDLSEKIGGSPF